MKPIRKILLPTDFSQSAEVALEMAIHIARAFEAEIILLHVIEPPSASLQSVKNPELLLAGYREAVKANASQKMTKLLELIRERGDFRTQTIFSDGWAFVEILRAAKQHEIDVIVMGTHGQNSINFLLIGNTAERVVRKAPCPVLTVRHPSFKFEMA